MTTTTISRDTSETQAVTKAEHIAALFELLDWAQDEESPDDLSDEVRTIVTDDLGLGLETDKDGWLDWDAIRGAADQHLRELPLSVEVRSDWHDYGDPADLKPVEFQILLCTGGPAVRILGRFEEFWGSHGPTAAWFEHQDWGTPWTEVVGVHTDTAVRFACFLLDA